MVVSPLGFLLATYIPDLKLAKPATWKCQCVQTKKAPTKVYCLYTKDQKRSSLAGQKNLDNNSSTPIKHHRKNFDPSLTYTSKGQMGTLNFDPCENASKNSPWGAVRDRTFFPTS